MKRKMYLLLALYFAFLSSVWAQEFPIGIWFGGNQNAIDSVNAMNFTWIQAYGGWDRNNFSTMVLQNNRNLKVLAILDRNINLSSFAQRMQYQAELENDGGGIFNYFARLQQKTGVSSGTVWQALTANHSAGYIAQAPVPDDQYFYKRMNWVATANMRIDQIPGQADTNRVVRIEIMNGSTPLAQRIVTKGEFGGSAALRTFEVAYTLPTPAPLPLSYKNPITAATITATSNPNIDVRVWWYDQVNTYLDWVALEDSVIHPDRIGAYQLFRGLRDSLITDDASFFASQSTYPLLQRFYLKDEPYYNGYQPFNYVDQHILNTAGMQGSGTGRGRGITATPTHSYGSANVNASFTRFMNDGRPYELFVDAYPIHADIPVHTSYIPADSAAIAGIIAYVSSADYNTRLQGSLGWMIANSFRPAIEVAQSSGAPWWYIAQVHGELSDSTGQYRKCDGTNDPMLRPPSPAEIRAMVNWDWQSAHTTAQRAFTYLACTVKFS